MTATTTETHIARHGAGLGGEHDENHRPRHAGDNPVLFEIESLDGTLHTYWLDRQVIRFSHGYVSDRPVDVGVALRHVERVHRLGGWVAEINPLCDRCRAHVADADRTDLPPSDEQLCQGCLDEASHAEEERRQAALIREIGGKVGWFE